MMHNKPPERFEEDNLGTNNVEADNLDKGSAKTSAKTSSTTSANTSTSNSAKTSPSNKSPITVGFVMYSGLIIIILSMMVIFLIKVIMIGNTYQPDIDKVQKSYSIIEAPRGRILDRNGNVLAMSVKNNPIIISPRDLIKDVEHYSDFRFQNLANLLGEKDPKKFYATLLDISINGKTKDRTTGYYVYRNVASLELLDSIRALKIKGIPEAIAPENIDITSYSRVYPYTYLISNIVGYSYESTTPTGEPLMKYANLEKVYNNELTGVDGKEHYQRDKKGNIIKYLGREEPKKGQDITLSIDINLQQRVHQIAEKTLVERQADSVSAVLLDSKTGEILSMVTVPTFEPYKRSASIANKFKGQELSKILQSPVASMRADPGSTFKPFVALGALDNTKKKFTLQTPVYIPSEPLVYSGARSDKIEEEIKSLHGQYTTLDEILIRSSNVGIIKVANYLNIDDMKSIFKKIGFDKDSKTKIGLTDTSSYISYTNNDDYTKAKFAYGYLMNTSVLSLARAYNVLANLGVYKDVSLLKLEQAPQGVRQFSERNTKAIIKILEGVAKYNLKSFDGLRSYQGTAAGSILVKGYNVAVKTGTTTKDYGGKLSYKNKNAHLAYIAGIAPSDNPRYTLVVLVDNPYGGTVAHNLKKHPTQGGGAAGPMFSEIMSYVLKYYNIPENNLDTKSIIMSDHQYK